MKICVREDDQTHTIKNRHRHHQMDKNCHDPFGKHPGPIKSQSLYCSGDFPPP